MNERDLKIDKLGPPPEGLTEEQLTDWKYQRYIKEYLRCVASIDDNVGRLLDYLDEADLTDNTMVIYTSDQGFFLGDHGWVRQAVHVRRIVANAVCRELSTGD